MALITVKRGGIEYEISAGIGVAHGFTNRLGGVSTGSLSSLNLGISRGDDPENVRENYRRLGLAMGFDPRKAVLCKQIHSDIVRYVGQEAWGAGLDQPSPEPCDGFITDVPGTALVVFTADCTPILFYDPVSGAVGAAHAGWRGTAQGIAARVVEQMQRRFGSKPSDLRCAIGANIGACCFQTDADVPDAMRNAYGRAADAYIRSAGEKYYVDLKGINAMVLREAGVAQIDISTECTVCRCDRYWSHRVTRGDRGSQSGIILCEEKKP